MKYDHRSLWPESGTARCITNYPTFKSETANWDTLRRLCGFRSHLCTHFCCPSGKVSERGRRSSGSCTSAQNRTFSAIPRNSYLCYFLRLKLQGIIYVSTAMAWNYLRFSLVSVKEFLYIECCRLTFIEMFIVWYSVFSNMLYTFLQYFNLYISV